MRTGGAMSGGMRKHFLAVAPRLLRDPRIDDLRILLPRGALRDLPDLPIVEWDAGVGDGRAVRAAMDDFPADVVFVPSARYVGRRGARSVVMVRNMEPLETPFAGNRLVDRLKNVARAVAARRACRRADRIIAVSNHVRDHLVDRLNIAASRIGVVYHGAEPPAPPRTPSALPDLTGSPFVFSAGSIRPARGLIDLVRALSDPRLPADLQLVFAGKADPGAEHYEARLRRLAEDSGVAGRIHWLGHCDRSAMSWGFLNCALFVMTSRAEACPNTVLEALSHACLSVSGDNAPMPEFFGDAALYYRIGDSGSLASQMVRALALSPTERQALRERAAERAQRFSWDRCADRTVEELLAARDA